jgi:hypothetical protein
LIVEHRYSVYGVTLSSDVPFDFPCGADDAHDGPHVRFARADAEDFAESAIGDPSADDWFVCREREDGSVYLRWSGLYEFLVDSHGACVRHRPLPGADPAVLQNFLFGQALSFALIRQNVEPVHAAVVDVGGSAIALLGDCTYGKSTLAALLLQAGCRLVSDDLLVVRESGGCLVACAGSGRIKLLPDSASAAFGAASGGARIMPQSDKRVFRLEGHLVQPNEVPLGAFVMLPTPAERAGCDSFAMHRLNGARVFHELLKNTFVRYVHDARRLHQNFAWNAQLAAAVDGYQLFYPSGINRLPAVARNLVDHFRHHSCGERE